MPGIVQGQVGWDLEQPGPGEGCLTIAEREQDDVYGPFQPQTIPGFCDSADSCKAHFRSVSNVLQLVNILYLKQQA